MNETRIRDDVLIYRIQYLSLITNQLVWRHVDDPRTQYELAVGELFPLPTISAVERDRVRMPAFLKPNDLKLPVEQFLTESEVRVFYLVKVKLIAGPYLVTIWELAGQGHDPEAFGT